jgi:hypothetical protein
MPKEFTPQIVISTLRHKDQRYDTVGDWKFHEPQGVLDVTVSKMSDWRYEVLVGIHETVEALLCKQRGVKEVDVTAFDVAYEAKRLKGDASEPGDDPIAPYHAEHVFATKIEKLLAAELGVDWDAYDKEIASL